MSVESYPPKKLATVELLTQEINFGNPKKIVEEINGYHTKNTKYDWEYYQLYGASPTGNEATIGGIMQILERHFQQAGSMEYHALVRAPSSKQSIPRIGDAILLRNRLIRALEVVKDVIAYKAKISDAEQQCYIEYFIQRWIYKFCRHVFSQENFQESLVSLFENEQDKEKEGFEDLVAIFIHLNNLHSNKSENENGYNPSNTRSLYIIFSNLLFAYLVGGINLPIHLQKIFIEFQRHPFLDYEAFKSDEESIQAEHKCLLINPDEVKPFFMRFKNINSPMKKAILIGMLTDVERTVIVENFCDLGIKGVAEMYNFIGKMLEGPQLSEAQGRDWLTNVYDTITKVVADKKIVENTSIPEEIRKVFGTPKSFPTPAFRRAKTGVTVSPEMMQRMRGEGASNEETPSEGAAPEEVNDVYVTPEIIDIPNLVAAQNLEELKDKGPSKNIVIVQDSNVLELVIKNWEIRGSLTFPELIEIARIPIQVRQGKAPGIREGRKFISFAYLVALDLDEEHFEKFVDKVERTNQIPPDHLEQFHKLYPIAAEELSPLKKLNIDARKMVNSQGHIIPNVFHEKCDNLRKLFMENYSYIQSLLSYWGLVEEMYYSIAKGVAVMGNIVDPTPQQIEQFTASKNEDYMAAYEKALNFAGPLKTYFKKKYNPELQRHFVNVKIKNDLLSFAKTNPVDLLDY